MKRYLISFILVTIIFTLNGQENIVNTTTFTPDFNYPQTVIKNSEEILNKATIAKNDDEIVMALIQSSLAKSMISSDSLPSIIKNIANIRYYITEPCIKATLNLLEAHIINSYYTQNKYKINSRNNLNKTNSSDIFAWDNNQFNQHISQLIDSALHFEKELKETPITKYRKFITINDNSISTYPTMYDFIAYRGISIYYSWSFSDLWNPFAKAIASNDDYYNKIINLYNELQLFHKDGSRPYINAILNKTIFENPQNVYNNPKLYSQLDSLYSIYKNNANVAPIILKLQYNNKKLYSIFSDYIAKFPNSNYTPLVQSRLNNLERTSAELYYEKQFSTTDSIRMTCHVKNSNNICISIYRIDKTPIALENIIKKDPILSKEYHINNIVPFTDTINISLPTLDYGIYVPIVYHTDSNGNKVQSDRKHNYYNPFIISDITSFFVKNSFNKNNAIFAVNATSGTPLNNVTITATQNNRNSTLLSKTTNKDGRIDLNDSNFNLFKFTLGTDKYYTANYYSYFYNQNYDEYQYRCEIFTDLAIYRPGETINLATVCYRSNTEKKEILKNLKTNITLFDTNNDTVSSATAFTDEMGRIAHNFTIPTNRLNGNFYIKVNSSDNKKLSAIKYINVSEYKTPTFYIEFTNEKQTYPENGNITLRGIAKTFSGVPLGNLDVQCSLQSSSWSNFSNIATTTISTDEMGFFEIVFDAKKVTEKQNNPFIRYRIQATITDKTGETQSSNSKAFFIGSELQISWAHNDITNIDASHLCTLPIKVINTNPNTSQSYNCILSLTNKHGEIIHMQFPSLKPEFDFSKIKSGEYTAQAWIGSDTAIRTAKTKIIIYRPSDKISPTESALWSPITHTNCIPGKKGSILLGNSFDKSYVYYTISYANKILKEGWITLKKGMSHFQYTMPKYANSSAVLCVEFNSFKNGKKYNHTVSVSPQIEQPKATLSISSFRDKITAGDHEKWTIHFDIKEKPVANGAILSVLTDKALNTLADNTWVFKPYMPQLFSNTCIYTQSLYTNTETFSWNNKTKPLNIPTFSEPELNFYNQVFFASQIRYRSLLSNAVLKESTSMNTETAFGSTDEKVVADETSVYASTVDGLNVENELKLTPLRSDVIKTVFWQPMLKTDLNGNTNIEFTVPDMNTTWLFQTVGYDKNLNATTLLKEIVSNKPIMVSPNMPRFLRQGDRAILMASIQNSTDSIKSGIASIELFNPINNTIYHTETFNFNLTANATTPVSIEYSIPDTINTIGFKIKASDGKFSDGEQVMIPVLPSVSPIIESIPFYINQNTYDYSINLPVYPSDATITLEYCNNPTWYIAMALPALKSNSTTTATQLAHAIFANLTACKLIENHPEIQEAITYWNENSKDSVLISMLEKNQDLKISTLLASPWLKESEVQTLRMIQLSELFDKNLSEFTTNKLIDKLAELQLVNGGFSWFKYPGAMVSEYVTYNVLQLIGEIKAIGAITPTNKLNDIAIKAINYIDTRIIDRYNNQKDKLAFDNYLNYAYTRSLFLDIPMSDTIKNLYNMITQSLTKEWKKMNIVDKTYTAITLANLDKMEVAKSILESIKQYSIYKPTTGRFWDNFQSGWYYYCNKVTLTSLILQAYHKIEPQSKDINQIRQWLLLEKQTSDWGNLSLAADAVYAMLSTGSNWLHTNSIPVFTLNDTTFTFNPLDRILGYGKIKLNMKGITAHQEINIKHNGQSPAWGAVYCQYSSQMDNVKTFATSGLSISKDIINYSNQANLKVGDKVQISLTIKNSRDLEFVTITDERAACFEPTEQISTYHYEDGIGYYMEVMDSKTNLFFNNLPKGTHVITYDAYITNAGDFNCGIATIQCQYAPQHTAHSAGLKIIVK